MPILSVYVSASIPENHSSPAFTAPTYQGLSRTGKYGRFPFSSYLLADLSSMHRCVPSASPNHQIRCCAAFSVILPTFQPNTQPFPVRHEPSSSFRLLQHHRILHRECHAEMLSGHFLCFSEHNREFCPL